MTLVGEGTRHRRQQVPRPCPRRVDAERIDHVPTVVRATGHPPAVQQQLSADGSPALRTETFLKDRFSRTVILLISMGASRTDAEDAAQEAIILAWKQWDSIREPTAWIRKVAIRAYAKQVRGRSNRLVSLDSAPELAASSDLSIFTEQQQHVLELLRALPERQRTVAALFYDGLTCEEIAACTGVRADTVRSNLRHARKALKEAIIGKTCANK